MQDIVLCKVYRKATSLKVLEQRAAMEEEMKNFHASPVSPPSPLMDTFSFCSQLETADQFITPPLMATNQMVLKKEVEEVVPLVDHHQGQEKDGKQLMGVKGSSTPTLQLPLGKNKLPEIQVPKMTNMDWTQDSFWAQLASSPWLHHNLTPYANIMNF